MIRELLIAEKYIRRVYARIDFKDEDYDKVKQVLDTFRNQKYDYDVLLEELKRNGVKVTGVDDTLNDLYLDFEKNEDIKMVEAME